MGAISRIYSLSSYAFGHDPEKAAASRKWQENRARIKAEKRKKRLRKEQVRKEYQKAGQQVYTRHGPVINYRPGLPSHEFYRTRSWLELRYTVLQKRGTKCECCGLSKKDGAIIHVDHIKPRSRFPNLELVESNLQVLCELCNIGKSNKYETDWKTGPSPSPVTGAPQAKTINK